MTTSRTPTPQRVRRVVDRLASLQLVAVSGLILFAFAVVFFGTSAPFSIPTVERACAAAPPDVRLYSSERDVEEFLDRCGSSGRTAYRNLQIADLAYPTVVGTFMAASLAVVLVRLFPAHPSRSNLAMLPLAGAAFDYVENAFAWRALAAFPGRAGTNSLLGVASAAKTITLWLAGLILLAGVAMLAFRAVRLRLFKRYRTRVVRLG